MKREALPALSGAGEQALASYERALCQEEDLAWASLRNYLSDLRHFAAWCEARWREGQEQEPPFIPAAVTTPTLTQYRTYLQQRLILSQLRSIARSSASNAILPGSSQRDRSP